VIVLALSPAGEQKQVDDQLEGRSAHEELVRHRRPAMSLDEWVTSSPTYLGTAAGDHFLHGSECASDVAILLRRRIGSRNDLH
jgi:hypothetical protein